MRHFRASLLFFCALLMPLTATADEPRRSASLMGPVGLNNVPSARMDQTGTMRIGVATLDPYFHSFASAQIADWLYLGVRQSAEKSSMLSRHDALYPGLDLKFTLNNEGRYDPEIALGFLSAFGHKKTASEYIALSKRYNNLDVTLGMGWGRLAGSGHIRNPLRRASSHFGDDRSFTTEQANSVHDWFTGEDVGFFGGIEYHLPVNGFSLKADWGTNPYGVEAGTISGYRKPADWSLALNYAPASWLDAMIGMQGTDKLMARLSFQNNVMDWLAAPYKKDMPPVVSRTKAQSDPDILRKDARGSGLYIGRIRPLSDTALSVHLSLRPHRPVSRQVGRTARYLANHAPPQIDTFFITPMRGKIAGKAIRILRRDIERAVIDHQGSPEEMWKHAAFESLIDEQKPRMPFLLDFNLSLQNDLSLTEDESEYLYRTSISARTRADLPAGYFAGIDLRANIKDNLDKLKSRPGYIADIRGNIDAYTRRRLYLERAYVGWRGQVLPDLFVANMAGAVEEMYSATGAEILYRPFGKTWAVGADSWVAFKREPADIWGMRTTGDNHISGHINLFYEIPESDITAYAKIGQFLAGDRGALIGVQHEFQNGVKLAAFGAATDQADGDAIGGTTHMHGGVTLSIPLGNMAYMPQGSDIVTRILPQGRSAGQIIDNPEPLYSVTEPVSYRGASRSWHRLLD